MCQCCPKHGATLTFHIVHINKPGQICPIYFGKYLPMLERGMIYQYKSYSFRYSWLQKKTVFSDICKDVSKYPQFTLHDGDVEPEAGGAGIIIYSKDTSTKSKNRKLPCFFCEKFVFHISQHPITQIRSKKSA